MPCAQAKLDQVAGALVHVDAQTTILLEGHTDSRGPESLNQALSRHRAVIVRSYLVSKGLAPERLVCQGHGPSRPIADNETAEGRANNRRVEVVVQLRK